MENGFKAMSRSADEAATHGQSETLEVMDDVTDAASERVGDFQQLLVDEIRARPLRALGWAAAAGVVLGMWAAR